MTEACELTSPSRGNEMSSSQVKEHLTDKFVGTLSTPTPALPLSMLVCRMAQTRWQLTTLEGRVRRKNVDLEKYSNFVTFDSVRALEGQRKPSFEQL